jgi:hypothetical protein
MSCLPSRSKSRITAPRPKAGSTARQPDFALTSRNVPLPRFSYSTSGSGSSPIGPVKTGAPLNVEYGGGLATSNFR